MRDNKRLNALAEIVEINRSTERTKERKTKRHWSNEALLLQQKEEGAASQMTKKTKNEGLLGSIQWFYELADRMAAHKALLLDSRKKLEDEELIDKFTDAMGLKVIGREAAQKLESEPNAALDSKDNSSMKIDRWMVWFVNETLWKK